MTILSSQRILSVLEIEPIPIFGVLRLISMFIDQQPSLSDFLWLSRYNSLPETDKISYFKGAENFNQVTIR